MFRRLPPDHDPELRRAIALDASEQRGLLATMCGEPRVDAEPSRRFTNFGVTQQRTPKGGLSLRPVPFPDDAELVMNGDSRELIVIVDNWMWRRRTRTSRAPAQIEALQQLLPSVARRGIHRIPLTETPREWRFSDAPRVIALMGQCLGITPTTFSTSAPCSARPYVEVSVQEPGSFVEAWEAKFYIVPEATKGNIHWGNAAHQSIETLQKTIAEWQAREKPAIDDDDDDDDDLDGLEKAARRTLHGAAGSPGGGTPSPRRAELMRRLDRLENSYFQVMEGMGTAMKDLVALLQKELKKGGGK